MLDVVQGQSGSLSPVSLLSLEGRLCLITFQQVGFKTHFAIQAVRLTVGNDFHVGVKT
jgi:hypothetical protein